MVYEALTLQVTDGVATVTLNRPERANALNRRLWDEIRQAFVEIDRTPAARVAVLRGTGRHFCSGIDVSMLDEILAITGGGDEACAGRAREKLRDFIVDLQDVVTSIERCRKPVIAAIQGACIGGAVDLIAACDLRYCTEDARFSVKEIDMGVVADVGSLQRLPRLIGESATRELAYTGRDFDGLEAEYIGLVNSCYPDAEALDKEVTALAAQLAAKPPLVLRGTKQVITHARDHSVAEGLEFVAGWNAATLASDDLREALAAFREKRAANYKD